MRPSLNLTEYSKEMPFVASVAGSYGYGRSRQLPQGSGTGLTSNDPGTSAQAIYNSGNTSNGWYWIRTSGMTRSYQVYCNMTDAGGAWMLVSYAGQKQSGTTASRGQFYPVVWSNGQGTFDNQFSANVMDLWYHNGSAQCSSLMRLAFSSNNAIPTLVNSYLGHMVNYTTSTNQLGLTIASGVQGTGVFSASNVVMGAIWSSLKGYTSLSTHVTKADSDWMYNTGNNFFWNPVLPIGGSSRSGSGTDIGGWMRTQDRDSWGLLGSAISGGSSAGSSFPGSTLAVFIR